MKKKLSVLFLSLFAVVTFTHAQSKKEVEADLIKCTSVKDSIQNELTGLSASYESISASYDSINKVCIAYDTMYNAVKEKVFQADFDPAKMSQLIDSLQTESFSGTSILKDSISVLQVENAELLAQIESMAAAAETEAEIINDLNQLKELLDAEILTQEEFDAKKAGLIEKL